MAVPAESLLGGCMRRYGLLRGICQNCIWIARPAEGFLSPLTPGPNVFCRGRHSDPHLGACANESPISDKQEIVNPQP